MQFAGDSERVCDMTLKERTHFMGYHSVLWSLRVFKGPPKMSAQVNSAFLQLGSIFTKNKDANKTFM